MWFCDDVFEQNGVATESLLYLFQRNRLPWVCLPRVGGRGGPSTFFRDKNLVPYFANLNPGFCPRQLQIEPTDQLFELLFLGSIGRPSTHEQISCGPASSAFNNGVSLVGVLEVIRDQSKMLRVNLAHCRDQVDFCLD